MPSYFFPQLADDSVLQAFDASLSQTCAATATMLAYLGELDHRRLYVRAAYPSMHQYCVREKHMSEHTADKRIRVARIARQFPAIFPALADGRLRLSAVLLLAPHLTAGTADELLAAAARRTNAEIELLLAHRFPRPDVPTLAQPLSVQETCEELAVRRVVPSDGPDVPLEMEPLSGPAAPRARVVPLSPGRFALQFTVDQATHDKLRYAQALLGHALPSGEVAKVFERALDALVNQLEKQKFAKCARSRPQRGTPKGRDIPAAVRRMVWERDGGQCTFVSEQGKRCESRTRLEWDHVEPVARGGQATPDNLRLRCRAHNQYAAERTFGHEFMRAKREQSRASAARAKARARADADARAREEAASERDVIPWLRELGYNAGRARKGADACAHIPEAPLEERLKVALRALAPHCVRWTPQAASAPA
jgi:5-methylcytosine-specific restriction endonuclease McrA